MRLGCGLPMLGPWAGPDAITRGAQRAEALGYHSVWVADRLLYPVAPRSPYPVGDGVMPEYFKRSMIAWTGAPTLDGFLAGLERFREAAG